MIWCLTNYIILKKQSVPEVIINLAIKLCLELSHPISYEQTHKQLERNPLNPTFLTLQQINCY